MPPQALQAIDRQAAADKQVQEEAAAAHKKDGHALPQSECASCVFQVEQLRKAEELRQMEERRKAEVVAPFPSFCCKG
jgi:hypothetical protein